VWLAEQGLDDARGRFFAKGARQGARPRAFDVIAAKKAGRSATSTAMKTAGLERGFEVGGFLLMESYRPEQLNYRTGGPPDAERMCTREMLQASFGDLSELDIREHDSVLNEGTAHVGMSALIDLVGKK
jgi:hypothetical protein